MTIKEQIAYVMGWTVLDPDVSDQDFFEGFNLHDWECVKALQARMVEDDHKIHIVHYPAADAENRPGKFECWASPLETYSGDPGGYEHSAYAATEPAALVELFKKVYGIKEGA